MLPNPWVLIGIGLAILSGWAAFAYERNELQDLRLAVQQQKVDAATKLAEETAKRAAVERAYDALKDELGTKDAQHQQQMAAEQDRNRGLAHDLAGALGRLRDLGRRGGGGDASVPGDTSGPGGCGELRSAVEKLSGAVGRLAEGGNDLARDADAEAGVAALGRDFAAGLRARQQVSP